LYEQQVKSFVEAGCKVVVTGGKVGELFLHYCNKFGLMVVRLLSKFDLRRLCKSIGATALPRLVSVSTDQCCSCLFVSGRTVVYRSHYKRPQFPLKVDFGGPYYRLQASHVASHVDWPSKTLLTVRPAR